MIEFLAGALVMWAACAAFPRIPDSLRKVITAMKGGGSGEGGGQP
jgi:hypothetical protein